MSYKVKLQPIAESDLVAAYEWSAKSAPVTAAKWVYRFRAALRSLAEHPRRCQVAPEGRRSKYEIRELHFGRRPNVFRAVYLIHEDTVYILRIRRASQRRLTGKELGEVEF